MKRLVDIRNKYNVLFDRVFAGCEFLKVDGNNYYFITKDGSKMKLTIGGNTILVNKDLEGKEVVEFIELPDDDRKFVSSMEMITENLENGIYFLTI